VYGVGVGFTTGVAVAVFDLAGALLVVDDEGVEAPAFDVGQNAN